MNEKELLKRLREAFKTEASERLRSLSDQLLKLESTTGIGLQQPILEVVYREAHSLKGAARAVNLIDIEALFQALENIIASIRKEQVPIPDTFFDLAYQCMITLESFLENFDEHHSTPENEKLRALTETLTAFSLADDKQHFFSPGEIVQETKPQANPEPAPEQESEPRPDKPQQIQTRPFNFSDSVRISTDKLDTIFCKVEEMISLKTESAQHVTHIKKLQQEFLTAGSALETMEKVFSEMKRNEDQQSAISVFFFEMAGLIETQKERFLSMNNQLRNLVKFVEHRRFNQARMVDDLLDETKKTMLQPCSVLFDQFPLMVREIMRQQGKTGDFRLHGTSVEIDRRILEQMKDPLIHLIRNAIDHGIETPEERLEKGKPPEGIIGLSCKQSGSRKVEMILVDDGRGIDIGSVKQKALQKGFVTTSEADNLSEKDWLNFIFKSGFSTAPLVTEVSGRGLGMAIVSEKIESLGGTLTVETIQDRGTTFSIEIPVSLATFRGVLLKVAGACFILPGNQVQEIIRVHQDQVKTVENHPAIFFRNQTTSLVDLASVLKMSHGQPAANENKTFLAAVIGSGVQVAAFRIDDVLGEEEILVKSLGKQLVKIPHITGASILGSGAVVPVLNPKELLNSVYEIKPLFDIEDNTSSNPKKILLAEDSITSRILIKNILESAGYHVKTAVDGQQAFHMLTSDPVDLVVSDVEMPNADGFQLTRMIRKKPEIETLPVVLVTSLGSREDREKGIEAGADAYIVKSEFDQHHLLDIIRMLI